MHEVKIRPALPEDVPALLTIYAPYVEKTAITFEYEIPSPEEFARRMTNIQTRFPYLVAELGDTVVGYAYAGPFKERMAYNWCTELTVYVREDCRGQGIGTLLYSKLEEILLAQGVLNLYACIAVPNGAEDEHLTWASQMFHARMGYRLVGTFDRCGYKFDRWYDMIWMEKEIAPHLEHQPPIRTFHEVRETIPGL